MTLFSNDSKQLLLKEEDADHFHITKTNNRNNVRALCLDRRKQLRFSNHQLNITAGDNTISSEKALGENARTLFDYLERKRS